MTAAAQSIRKNIVNTAHQGISRTTRVITPSTTRSPSPSLSTLQKTVFNRAKQAAALSARAKAGHATRRARELSTFGSSLTTRERSFQRFMRTHLNEVLLPQCRAEDIDPVSVVNYALEQTRAVVKARKTSRP